MHRLSASELVVIWEQGVSQSPACRALCLLAAACPEETWESLCRLPIGERDGRLLTLRALTFGPLMSGFVACPQCAERLEFTFRADDLRSGKPAPGERAEMRLETGGFTLRFRPPDSLDMAAAESCPDVSRAKAALIERCLLSASKEGQKVSACDLPEPALEAMAGLMTQRNPQAETLLDMECPACSHRWLVVFDIAAFFWAEAAAQAHRLMREVHALARAYGWSEADILKMSAARRHKYLELIHG
ncbi:MAG: phage baseplate protein [Armatimonadetes bacterium]|nr:phage baseplate protein [Armatimonadota bacterium]